MENSSSIFIFVVILGIYFIPSMVADTKRNFAAIFVLNLFLGWTFIGWVVALVWACSKDRKDNTIVITDEKKTWTKQELKDILKKMSDDNH